MESTWGSILAPGKRGPPALPDFAGGVRTDATPIKPKSQNETIRNRVFNPIDFSMPAKRYNHPEGETNEHNQSTKVPGKRRGCGRRRNRGSGSGQCTGETQPGETHQTGDLP